MEVVAAQLEEVGEEGEQLLGTAAIILRSRRRSRWVESSVNKRTTPSRHC